MLNSPKLVFQNNVVKLTNQLAMVGESSLCRPGILRFITLAWCAVNTVALEMHVDHNHHVAYMLWQKQFVTMISFGNVCQNF